MGKQHPSESTRQNNGYNPEIQQSDNKVAKLESENFILKNLIDTLPGDIYWKDRNGVWIGLNKHCAQSLQRMGFIKNDMESDVIGKTDYQLFNKITADGYRKNDNEVMEKNIELSLEEATHLASGEIVTLLSTKRPLRDKEGQVIGILGNTIDISYLKKIESDLHKAKERAELANQAKTEFLANMRHDIRTPLSGIVGFSEILKSEANDIRIKEYAENLIISSHALLDLMDEVLDAIKISSGEIPLLKKKFNLAQTLEHVTQLYSAKAAEKKLVLSLVCDHKLPHFVIGDKVRLHRIVLELVGNALNFTDSGHVTINVEQAKKEQQSLILRLTVTDTGIGIPKDQQQDVYVQFKRLTPSYQGIYKGTGLGLYVVKQFIDELNGEIYVESEPNKGTVFTCLIPLQIPLIDDDSGVDTLDELKSPPPLMDPLNHQSHAPHPNKKALSHILVVEDNFIAQTIAKAILTPMNCKVDVASSGADALKLCEQHHYDLIFMDIGLGQGVDGYEVTRSIRLKKKTTPRIPIIALTAHGADESKQRCIEAGMDSVLIKPLTQARARDILHSFIPTRSESPTSESVPVRMDLPDSDEELFQLSQFSLLNSEEALKNCGSLDMVKNLLTLMITQLPNDLALMKSAYAIKDFSLIEKTAHKIKGGAVYVGTARMRYACQYLERYWISGQCDLFEALYHQAIATIEETVTYIEGWLRK